MGVFSRVVIAQIMAERLPKDAKSKQTVTNSDSRHLFWYAKKQQSQSVATLVPDKEIVRVTFRPHGPELAQVREVRDMLSLNSELDAARYLMQRGLEAISATLASHNASESMASQINAQAVLEQMVKTMAKLESAKRQRGERNDRKYSREGHRWDFLK